MRIPPHLLPEIAARHAAGQSDSAIVRWLAGLQPPVQVSRIAVLQARRRAGGPPSAGPAASAEPGELPPVPVEDTPSPPVDSAVPADEPAPPVPSMLAPKVKASGAQNAKARAERQAEEATAHQHRGAVLVDLPAPALERVHIFELEVLAAYQVAINKDGLMTLPEKVRQSAMLAQAMAKLATQADLERRIEELEQQRATEVEDLKADRRQVEMERRRTEGERAKLQEEWGKLRAEQERLSALGGQIGAAAN
jgi:hypothetical protein